jgi:hypothetical protein
LERHYKGGRSHFAESGVLSGRLAKPARFSSDCFKPVNAVLITSLETVALKWKRLLLVP